MTTLCGQDMRFRTSYPIKRKEASVSNTDKSKVAFFNLLNCIIQVKKNNKEKHAISFQDLEKKLLRVILSRNIVLLQIVFAGR